MTHRECWYLDVCKKAPHECRETCIRYIEMKTLLELSNLPEAKWFPIPLIPGCDREAFIRLKEIKNNIEEWVKSGNNLYIYSYNFGNGKTSWAIKLMLAYFNAIWAGNGFRRRGVFVSVPEFVDRSREVLNNRDPEFIQLREDLITCDLVIWDDISSIKLTDFNHSLLLNYIDARMLAHRSNIFTGNADYTLMEEYLGGRLSSRIWNASEVIEFRDADKRGI